MKEQMINRLALSRENPRTVAGMDFSRTLYGDTPLGRDPTPETVSAITIDDVRSFYQNFVRPEGAILIIDGDITEERGKELAKTLLDGWKVETPQPRQPDYTLPPAPAKRKIILVDRPGGKQATIRMGIRAYDIHTDDKFAGSVASQILTSGIDSRLGKYVRAEKGLAYGVTGTFSPGRHAGAFIGSTDTAVESAGAAVEAMWKVFEDMRRENVLPKELAEAQMRVAGSMVMSMQTIQQQASYRVDAILNGYPIDYYDVYPQKIAQVTQEQIREVMNKYVKDDQMVVIVVAPAEAVKGQLEKLGDVEVVPMPAKREGAKPRDQELLKKKAA
jgi:zinc protease